MPADIDWYYYDDDYFFAGGLTCADFAEKDLCTMDGTKGAAFDGYFHPDQTKQLHEMTNDLGTNHHALNCPECGCVEPAGNNYYNNKFSCQKLNYLQLTQ